jgi:hypothetical protein
MTSAYRGDSLMRGRSKSMSPDGTSWKPIGIRH